MAKVEFDTDDDEDVSYCCLALPAGVRLYQLQVECKCGGRLSLGISLWYDGCTAKCRHCGQMFYLEVAGESAHQPDPFLNQRVREGKPQIPYGLTWRPR